MKEAIVIVTPGFPADEQDTACLPAFQQFALSMKRCAPQKEIIVLSFQYPFQKKDYRWHDIPVIALGGKNRSKLFRLWTWIAADRALNRIQSQYKISGMISLWITECALVANHFSKKHSLPHLIWIIGQDAKKGNKYVQRIRPHAEQLIAMSDFLQLEFNKNYAIRPMHVVENGVNAQAFPHYNSGDRPIDVMGAGSLIPLKNYKLFIGLIAELKKSFPKIKALIAGDGEEKIMLQDLIKKYSLENNLTLVGAKSHAETLRLMSQSKMFLHTSTYEGNSTVLMEALYSGCQVVSTCPLANKSVEHLFVGKNPDELLKQLHLLLSSSIDQKQVVFNTMDHSATRIIKLLGA